MLIYLAKYLPFKSNLDNGLNIFNEVVLFMCFCSILIMNVVNVPCAVIQALGWVFIALITVALMVLWINTVPSVIKKILSILKK